MSGIGGPGASVLRRRLGLVAMAALTTWACGDGGTDSPLDVDSSAQVAVRKLVQELPPAGLLSDDLFLESARGFDLFGDTVAVADRMAGRVQLFRSSGEHIATLGGPLGPGDPEILESPWRVQFAPDGSLWIGDPGRAALIRFPSGGGEPQTARLPGATMATAVGFGVDHVLGAIGLSARPRFLLAAYGLADGPLDIPSEVPLPEELTFGPVDRISAQHVVMSVGREGEVILLDGVRTILWRIELEYDPSRIVRISRIAVPDWLVESTRAEMEQRVAGRPGVSAPGFKDMRAGERGVWLVPAIDPVDGVFLPYEEDGRATVLWRNPQQRQGAWSSRILDDGTAWLMFPGSLMRFTVAGEG
ncbi:MAG: hypothetical protein F4X22_13530 [Gemmatimonadales bacterium]|nr:hypothetical protein [Candidatus Palauibacter denitrificans]